MNNIDQDILVFFYKTYHWLKIIKLVGYYCMIFYDSSMLKVVQLTETSQM